MNQPVFQKLDIFLVFITILTYKLLIAVTPEITDTADKVHNRRNSSPTEKNIYNTENRFSGIKIINANPTDKPSKKESYKSIFHIKMFLIIYININDAL